MVDLDPAGPSYPNSDPKAAVLHLEFLRSPLPIAFLPHSLGGFHTDYAAPGAEELASLNDILKQGKNFAAVPCAGLTLTCTDPLHWLSEEEKALLWRHRYFMLYHRPHHVTKLLLSVKWTDPLEVQEIHG